MTLALGTGMRLGEILGLRWKDVDVDRKVLRVTATLSYAKDEYLFTPPKTSRARRTVDLPPSSSRTCVITARIRCSSRWRTATCGWHRRGVGQRDR